MKKEFTDALEDNKSEQVHSEATSRLATISITAPSLSFSGSQRSNIRRQSNITYLWFSSSSDSETP